MQYLPTDEEQKWLTRYVRKLVERMGHEQFVSAPILLPDRTWFPDPWEGTLGDAHVVTQRLMHYAGIGQLRVYLEGYVEFQDVFEHETRDAVGFFNGISDGYAYFGLQLAMLDHAEITAGTMAHEVAHAWRAHHHLVPQDAPDRDELLTDVTTVYLGFGVLTTNDTHRYRKDGQSWSTSGYGYLPLQAMSYLLGLQLAARNDREEIRAIERELEPNQQRCVIETMKALQHEDVLSMLALPPRASWPPRRTRPESITIIDPGDDVIEPEYEDELPWNHGETVYRIRRHSIAAAMLGGILLGGVAGVLLAIILVRFDFIADARMPIVIACAAGALIAAFHRTTYVCSHDDCRTKLDEHTAICPGCGGTIGGTVRASDLLRLKEENLERQAQQIEFEDCAACAPEQPCARHAS